jgi:serine/threonine-protein kinase
MYRTHQQEHVWFLAMEYMAGGSLRDRLRKQNGPLEPAAVLRFARDITLALIVAGEQGLLHRNINPSCILFDAAGTAKLGDFSLMRGEVLETMQQITQIDTAVGDYVYQAPEQLGGEADLKPACDIYGLAATMYEALTGRPPFAPRSDLTQMLQTIATQPVESPRRWNPGIPPALEQLLLRALAKDPAARFGNAAEFQAALQQVERS